jgi:hypothetical protein
MIENQIKILFSCDVVDKQFDDQKTQSSVLLESSGHARRARRAPLTQLSDLATALLHFKGHRR